MRLKVVTEVRKGAQCSQQPLPLAVYEEQSMQAKLTLSTNNINAISYLHVTIQQMLQYGALGALASSRLHSNLACELLRMPISRWSVIVPSHYSAAEECKSLCDLL